MKTKNIWFLLIVFLVLVSTSVLISCGRKVETLIATATTTTTTSITTTTLDTTGPEVINNYPADGAEDVPLNAVISIGFNEQLSSSTINSNTFQVKPQGGLALAGTIISETDVAAISFRPAQNLVTETTYEVSLSRGISDEAGNSLVTAFSFSFTTGTTIDSTIPSVEAVSPQHEASGVSVDTVITARFSKAMNAATIHSGSFISGSGTWSVSGDISYDASSKTAYLVPDQALRYGSTYICELLAVSDSSGNQLAAVYTWVFETATTTTTTSTTTTTTTQAGQTTTTNTTTTTNSSLLSNWILITNEAAFSKREYHSLVSFDDGSGEKMFLIAGLGKKDLWSSTDGLSWTEVTSEAPFGNRAAFDGVVYNGKIWVIGGWNGMHNNDVWSSSDGLNWIEVTSEAPFKPRSYHSTVSFDGKLFLIAGSGNAGALNDVWNTTDGLSWNLVTSSAAFSARASHKAIAYDDGGGDKVWVMGGDAGSSGFGDVWYSSDGRNWFEATDSAAFIELTSHTSVVYDDNNGEKIWLLGGYYKIAPHNKVFSSNDGVNWTQPTLNSSFPPRFNHASTVFNAGGGDRVFIIGGANESNSLNDVWASQAP